MSSIKEIKNNYNIYVEEIAQLLHEFLKQKNPYQNTDKGLKKRRRLTLPPSKGQYHQRKQA